MHRAAQGAGIAVAFERGETGRRGLLLVVIDPHHEIRIAGLDRRMDQVPGEHRLIATAPGADRKVIGRMAGCRTVPDVVVDGIVTGHDSAFFASMIGRTLSRIGSSGVSR